MAFLGFLLVVVVGALCAKAFFLLYSKVCFWFGLWFLVCLVVVVEANGFFYVGCC